ncbi:hypothetical protein ACYE2N_04210 [Flavobacterium sp. MAHUQ-51]|uniref:hypothetical protein n=1 Tax=Flavobacterium sp. GCM10022190 TaxID=3252639 RepID=UPI0036154665
MGNTILESNKIKIKSSRFQIEEIVELKNNVVFERFINWVMGEFDLFLQDEDEKKLKVYFPNGWFSIDYFQNTDIKIGVAIKVEGKSKVINQEIMNQLMQIYIRIYDFHNAIHILVDKKYSSK